MPGPLIAGIVGSVASGAIQAGAANKAAKAQGKTADAQIAESRRQFDLVQGLLKPYVVAGTGALQGQLDLIGIGGGAGAVAPSIETIAGTAGTGGIGGFGSFGPQGGTATKYRVNGQDFATMQEAQAFANSNKTGGQSAIDAQRAAIASISNGEQFQALAQQGEYGILANGSATGGLRGGNTQGALAQYRPQLLQSLIQQQLANLGGVAANGQNAAGMTGTAAQNTGAQVNQALGDKGAAQAGGALAAGQAWNNAGAGILQTLGGLSGPTAQGGGAWQRWTF